MSSADVPASPVSSTPPPFAPVSVKAAHRLLRLLCTSNPFYAISAAMFLFGLNLSFSANGNEIDSWVLMGGLAGYTMLLAAAALVLVRFAGVWNDVRTVLLLVVLMFLAEQSNSTTFNSDTYPVLARPFTNANIGGQFSEFGAFPGIATGSIAIDSTAELWGAGVRLRRPLWDRCRGGIDLLAGFQFLSLEESLTITETPTFLSGGPFPTLSGLSFVAVDRFATSNQFYGGQLGIAARQRRGNWLLDLRALIGIGSTHQEVDIQGGQRVTNSSGEVTLYQGGLLALPGANIGRVSRNVFSVVPQVGLNLGFQITERMSVFAGYSFLYWSNVVRPGDQIDPVIDVTRIPNFITNASPIQPPRPANPFRSSDFWAHGVNFGLGLNW